MTGRDRPVLVLAGPTGVGKSSLALAVAETVGAEIVSADSRQVYRGLTIGTAAPSAAECARVPHHLVGHLDSLQGYSAGVFLDDFRETITEVRRRGGAALVVGGSTLYVHALVRGLADLPPVADDLALQVAAEATTREGRDALFQELRAADPTAAATLDPTKGQRLARLVGLLRETGRAPSELWDEAARPAVPHRLIILERPRPELYERIERRVDAMIDDGLVDEVSGLLARDPSPRPLLETTIGYREIAASLDGRLPLDEAIRLIKRNSRRYAKRQLTWYRRYDEAVWLDARTATVADVLDAAAPWPLSTYRA